MKNCAKLRLFILGTLKITLDETPLRGFISTKVQALLCYLALTPGVHSREMLAGLLWGGMSDTDAKTNLRQALANLRRLVGDHLIIERDAVTFDRTTSYWLDAEQFEQIANSQLQIADSEQAVSDMQFAISHYRGDLLEGFYVRDAPEFEEWLVGQRERFRVRVLRMLHALVDYHSSRGEYTQGIDYARRLLTLDPWREEAHRQLMLLYARNGERSAALAQYETCRRVLDEQLKVTPSAETVRLYERLQSANAMPRLNLPPQVTPFLGRENELRDLTRYLADPTCRLLTLVGQGGIGKTRLALQLASNVTASFLHGICFVPLASVNCPDLIISSLMSALQQKLTKGDPKTQLLDYLRDKEMLLVLDNFEHLLSGAAFLAEILQTTPDVKLLVTSRQRLNVYGETVFPLAGLLYPADEKTREVSECSAVQLFLSSGRRMNAQWTFSDEELASVIHICRLLDGLPLGIELAATWVHALDCTSIAREIDRTLDFLSSTQHNTPERHQSLRAVFEYSWNRLTTGEQNTFRKLSVFRGGFDREAAEHITGTSLAVLSGLVDKSFLHCTPSGRYELHEVMRQYGQEQLEASDENQVTHRKHAEYFIVLAEKGESQLKGAAQVAWLERLETELANLRAALGWAIEHNETEYALRLGHALTLFFLIRSYYTEGRQWLEQILNLTADTDTPSQLRAKILGDAGRVATQQGDFSAARKFYQASLDTFRALDAKDGIAQALSDLGTLDFYQTDYASARVLLEESVTLLRELGDKQNISRSLNNLAGVVRLLGDYSTAHHLYQENLTLRQEVNDKRGVANALSNLGLLTAFEKDYETAYTWQSESLALRRELGDKWGVAISLNNLGFCVLKQEKIDQARAFYRESALVRHEIGDKRGLTYTLQGMTSLAITEGQWERSARLAGATQALIDAIGAPLETEFQTELESAIAIASAHLGDVKFAEALAKGRAMTFEQAIVYALEST